MGPKPVLVSIDLVHEVLQHMQSLLGAVNLHSPVDDLLEELAVADFSS